MMENRPDYVAIWIGLSRIGVVVALLNPRLGRSQPCPLHEAAALQHLIVDAANLGALEPRSGRRLRSASTFMARSTAISNGSIRPSNAFPPPLGADEGERPLLSDVALANLHLWHDRHAEGGFREPLPHRDVERMVCRNHGRPSRGSSLQLFAVVPQRRRCCRCRLSSGRGRIGHRASQLFGDPILGRCNRLAGDHFSLYRRTVSLLADCRKVKGRRRHIICGSVLAMACARMSGKRSPKPSPSRGLSNSMHRLKGAFRCSIWRESRAAIGRTPPFLAHRSPVALVKFDFATEQPLRGSDGHCLRCATA